MKGYKLHGTLYLILGSFIINLVLCHPLGKPDPDNKLNKDEKRYPNGTVIGKYSYTDNDGNPIQVKYFADDASYGVELKSIKLMGSSSENPLMKTFKQSTIDNLLQGSDASFGMGTNFYNPTNIKYKTSDPFEILNKDKNKNNPFKVDSKTNPDYEIYFQNELKAPNKCGKDKVRVYLDKNKRKIRDLSDSLEETAKFCSQF